MKKSFSHSSVFVTAFLILLYILPTGCAEYPEMTIAGWYRGNTHTHARFSDKVDRDDVPEIAGWYRKRGYNFLLLSEHNDHLENKRTICHDELSVPGKFIMLCGLELSLSKHHTALGITRYIGDEESLQDGVSKTISAGGLAILNHPYSSRVSMRSFIDIKGLNHLELVNGGRMEQTPYVEMLWDSILSAPDGRPVFAVASDDNHFKGWRVGRGWIMVKAPALTKEDIETSIQNGNFYATTGVYLNDITVSPESISIDSRDGSAISFIGRNGKLLASFEDRKATYKFNGDELYVRAKITNSRSEAAWTQPVFPAVPVNK
jgi:hypothetical protein